jgi:hypothetical protein
MVFALETYWPATDGYSAARIEEEIVVTPSGHQIITRFPADELLVAGASYYTANSALSGKDEGEPRWSEDLGTVLPDVARVAPDSAEPVQQAGPAQPALVPSGE